MAFTDILKIIKEAAPYVSAAGDVASTIGKQRAAGRGLENLEAREGDKAAQERYKTEQLAKLGAAQLTENATQDRADRVLTNARDRAQQVGLGDLLSNVQDVDIQGLPSYINKINFSGGLRPSALGPMSRQAGTNLAQQALAAQMSGSDIPVLPDTSKLGTDAPALSEMQQAGGLDKVLELLGYAGAGAGLYGELEDQREKKEAARAALEARNAPQPLPAGAGTNPNLFGDLFRPTTPIRPTNIAQLLASRNPVPPAYRG
jgi:hypothetical protein